MDAQPRFDGFATDEVGFALVDDAKAFVQPHMPGLLPDNVMCQSMQRADTIAVQRLERVIEEAFDARLEVVYRRVDKGHDQHFLIVGEGTAGNDLRRECGEDLRLARAGHCGNAEASAAITENLFLGGTGCKVDHICYSVDSQFSTCWKARSRSPRCSNPLSPSSARQR